MLSLVSLNPQPPGLECIAIIKVKTAQGWQGGWVAQLVKRFTQSRLSSQSQGSELKPRAGLHMLGVEPA